jgi:hypothetical protein
MFGPVYSNTRGLKYNVNGNRNVDLHEVSDDANEKK